MDNTVLITGGAHRLGALLCRSFARVGWQVWCHYQSSEEAAESLRCELEKLGLIIHIIQADLEDDLQRTQMMNQIVAQTGPLRCLVNNASAFEPDRADSFEIESARQLLEINLIAPVALSALMAQSSPIHQMPGLRSIIHVLDQKVLNLNPDYFFYTLSKLALERAVALQAQALAPKLRVCGVAPGLIFRSGPQTQQNFDLASKINLLRQPTEPEQVAATCLFLAENSCITGVTLAVDSGQHLLPLTKDVMFVVDDFLKDTK